MWLLTTLACGPSVYDRGCLHGDLDDWCRHDEASRGPVGEGTCEDPEPSPRYRCGDYDVDAWGGGGFTSESYYFDRASGELVAVVYRTDVNHYCGGFQYWYGRRIECELECSYVEDDDLPECE